MKCQAALVLMLAYFTAAYKCPSRTYVNKVFEVDLSNGDTYVRGGYGISWLTPLTGQVSGACSRQGVIKITYPTLPQNGKQRLCFKFDLHFSSPSGWNLTSETQLMMATEETLVEHQMLLKYTTLETASSCIESLLFEFESLSL